jgi:hypothetical protein
MIQELLDYLNNRPRSPWDCLGKDNKSIQLTALFCNTDGEDFLILTDANIVHEVYKKKAGWKSDIVGQPNVLISMEDAAILPELECQYSAINWVAVEGDVSVTYTPFMARFQDRINAIIDMAYANLK